MNYYKSPDHLGPVIARALEIPYLIVEASDAPKRATGHFAAPYAAAKKALEAADAVCALTALDATGLAKIVAPDRLRRLPPFIDDAAFRAPAGTHRDPHRIVSTAMLRPGKKLANFPLVADALARIADLDWRYAVAGDGAGRPEVEAALRRLPTDRVDLRGRITPDAIPAFYASAGIYLWPGLREGYGLAYLEAQACATPVVACDGAGVPAVVEHGRGGLLSPTGDAGALASSLRRLLTDEPYRASLGETAEAFVHRERTIAGAAARLRTIMSEIGA